VDPDIDTFRLDPSLIDSSTSPDLNLASSLSLIFNDSKIDRHNNTTIQQHTLPVINFNTDVIQKKFFILIHRLCTSPKTQTFAFTCKLTKKDQTDPRLLVSYLPLSSLPLLYFLQHELNYASNATEDLKHNQALLYPTPHSPLSCLFSILLFPKNSALLKKQTFRSFPPNFREFLPEASPILQCRHYP